MRACDRGGLPYRLLGGGTNLLVADEGVSGVVISLAQLNGFRVREDAPRGNTVLVEVGAGTRLASIIKAAIKRGLAGLEQLVGIPGTVGGAVAMNAGAWGREIGETVEQVFTVGSDGVEGVRSEPDLEFAYRHCELGGDVVTGVALRLVRSDQQTVEREARHYLRQRQTSQPVNACSAGCIFKNPGSRSAGELIEASGFKNVKQGGALVSDIHANFIINDRRATAKDVLGLIDLIRRRVREEHGIELELEIDVWT